MQKLNTGDPCPCCGQPMFGVTRSAIGDWCRQRGVKPTLDPKSTHYRRMQNAD